MTDSIYRREFLVRTLQAGTLFKLGDLAFLNGLPPVSASQARVPSHKVQFSSDIEPLVRLIEDTPRDKLLEVVAGRIRKNLSYQEVLAALLLAGVRSIKPRPVGFQFHAVLVVNSAYLASIAAADRDRWLPFFWALDNFKESQEINQQEGGWVMAPLPEGKLPSSSQAKQRFIEAMDNWDEEGADLAIASLVRNAGASEIIELFWRYGARDFRDIGHKAIYAANSWRTLQCIGWRHAEPVMRSLAFAMLEHEGGNPAKRDADPDRPGRENLKRVSKIRSGWQHGRVDARDVPDFLVTLRTASPENACQRVVELLNQGVDPASLWDGLFLQAGELIMRQPGIVGVHCVTSINALYYAYQMSGNDETRRLLLLQAAAFLPLFRKFMGLGKIGDDQRIDTLTKLDVAVRGPDSIAEIFVDVSKDPVIAARKTLAVLDEKADPKAIFAAARRLIFAKGTDAHDYKFSSAAFEDYYHATSAWRNRYLATSMFNLCGSGDPDNDLIKRTRTALGA